MKHRDVKDSDVIVYDGINNRSHTNKRIHNMFDSYTLLLLPHQYDLLSLQSIITDVAETFL
jgi:hypothetical protein